MTKFLALVLSTVALGVFVAVPAVQAATTVAVRPSNLQGWTIQPDGLVPYSFVTGPASTGAGSLQFGAVGTPDPNKFIMRSPFQGLAAVLQSFTYDFFPASTGATDFKQFYVNVYVDSSTNSIGFFGSGTTTSGFYDCRYDSVPLAGPTGLWSTHGFTQTSPWTNVANRLPVSGACPPTLAGLAPGSTIFAIVLNGGDSSGNDSALMGNYDNVVITTTSGAIAYDFEPEIGPPTSADQCKDGGWRTFTVPVFKNQGDCIQYVNTGK